MISNYCSFCGTKLKNTDEICPSCGKTISEEQYAEIAEAYTEKYGPFEPSAEGSGSAWLKAPWPWTNCGGNA